MILIAYEPKKNKVTINGKEYVCHSVYRLIQILQDMSYSTDTKYWLREGGQHEDN